jgi:hypothetical protein
MDNQPIATPTPTPTPTVQSSVPVAANQPVATSNSAVSLDGVESSFSDYLVHKWYILVAIIILMGGFFLVNPVISIVILVAGSYYFKSAYENNLFAAFAKANNFNYDHNGGIGPQAGLIFTIGHSQKSQDLVSGNYKNWPFQLYIYDYTVGYGRDQHTYNRAVFSVNFSITTPVFLLRRHKRFPILTEEGESLKSHGYTQKLGLEGNFDDHFQVFIQPNSQVEVLTVLTPNVMEVLLSLDKYEIELTANGVLYIYTPKYITKKQELIEVYQIVEALTDTISHFVEQQKLLGKV